FDEGQKHKNPYFLTKFLAEKVVRDECQTRYMIYRPGAVVGSSVTGEADKIDGIYYAFKLIQRMRKALPSWFPLVGFEGSELHVVPVDYVAGAIDAIAHNGEVTSNTFHLTDPKPESFGDALNLICEAAHAPRFDARIDPRVAVWPRRSIGRNARSEDGASRGVGGHWHSGIGPAVRQLALLVRHP
ncbi:MAG: SDR family oxidoreductase, partial [Deltaproteobacteria bacterium]|nr:SDR family oxidoreductase [Deltaproteobacteria bacterium]